MENIIGEKIKEFRESQGLSQGQFSKKIGHKTYMVVSKWERGINIPNASSLVKMSKVFDIEITIKKNQIFFKKSNKKFAHKP